MTERPKIYIDGELYYPMNAAGFIQFAKDRTMVLCIPGIPEARVIVGEKTVVSARKTTDQGSGQI
jgi:hypothetical protein